MVQTSVTNKLKKSVTDDGRLYIPKIFLENIGVNEGEDCYIEEIELDGLHFIAVSKEGLIADRLNELLNNKDGE